MRKLREEEQRGSWRDPEQQDEAGGKKKYIAEREKWTRRKQETLGGEEKVWVEMHVLLPSSSKNY